MGQFHHFLLPEPGSNADVLDEKHIEWNVLHHIKVLRVKKSETIRLMDGQGSVSEYQCLQVKPYQFKRLQQFRQPPLRPQIELCLAPPRADLSEAIQQATEIGASSVRLLRTDFVQYAAHLEAPSVKAQRVADAACEQCARAWKCSVLPGWHDIAGVLKLPGTHVFADEILATSEPEKIGFTNSLPQFDWNQPVRLYIGPEGGWSERERHIFDGKAAPLSLGSLILRVPTAIVASIHFLKTVYSHSREG